AFFAPVVTTLVAVAVVWRYLLHTRYGLLNYALAGIGIHPIDWLGDPHWALPAIILFAVWKNFGYNMVIFVAALQTIPADLYEAARLDGASLWQEFRRITLPMLRPTLLLVSILTVAGYFQLFAEPYVMTRGGPLQSTVSVLYYMYEQGFKWWDLGSASAVAFLLFLMNLADSLWLASITTALSLVLNSLAGYAFAKLRFRGRESLLRLLLAALVIPSQVAMLPLFLMMKWLGLVNTYAGVVIPAMAGIFGVFLVRQYALAIPDELLEGARIDGAGEMR